MKSLHVALIVKNTPTAFERQKRNMGLWSYETPEFTWQHFSPGKDFKLNTHDLKRQGFDFVFQEDGGNWGVYIGNAIPVIYYSIDSTLSIDRHYIPRLRQARQADLILVDHDRLDHFAVKGISTRRLLYCVNDYLFKPGAKTIDVNFHCGGSDHRLLIRRQLDAICKAQQWSYVSGVVDLYRYAADLSISKIVVNIPRNEANRPHRVYDAMACKTCLLSRPFPIAPEEGFIDEQHYLSFDTDIEYKLSYLMEGAWESIAAKGHEWVTQNHTWTVRSRQLRQIVFEELGL